MIETPLIKELKKPLRANGREFLEAIFENNKRKNTCDLHVFDIRLANNFTHTFQHQCSKCGYACDRSFKEAYEMGLKHGGVQ